MSNYSNTSRRQENGVFKKVYAQIENDADQQGNCGATTPVKGIIAYAALSYLIEVI